jgi:hypothetical protein
MRKKRLIHALRICTGFAFLLLLLMPSAQGNELRKLTLDNAATLANDHMSGRSERA